MTGFLIDQLLPQALARYLIEHGQDARHIKDYPGGPSLPDADVAELADADDRFVLTKDADFRISHLLRRPPAKLLHVTCGNVSTRGLLAIFDEHWTELLAATSAHSYVEIDRPGVVIHDPD